MSSRSIIPETQLYGRLAAIDPTLVGRVADGERAAFDRIFDALFPVVWALSVQSVGFMQRDAERLTESILERVVPALETYAPDTDFAEWLRALIDDELRAFGRGHERRGITSQRSPVQPRP